MQNWGKVINFAQSNNFYILFIFIMEEQNQYPEDTVAGYADPSPLRKARYFAVSGVLFSLVSVIYSFLNPHSIGLEVHDYITISYIIGWANRLCFIGVAWMMLKTKNGYIQQGGKLLLAAMIFMFIVDILFYASLVPVEYMNLVILSVNVVCSLLIVASLTLFFIGGNCDGFQIYKLCLIYVVLVGTCCVSVVSAGLSMYQAGYILGLINAIAFFMAFKPWWRLLSDANPKVIGADESGSLLKNVTNQAVIGFMVSVTIMISIIKILSNTL